jgi:beta-xylosidase
MMMKKRAILMAAVGLFAAVAAQAEKAKNPIIWADVPDPSIVRVGDAYYMSSTTMHMSPGVPIMKSTDLSNWEVVNYAYDRLVENDKMNLENGQNAYGKGSWASCIRYHNDTYYVSTFSSTSGKTHVYSTKDIEKGPWKAVEFSPSLHDNSLFFDDDGRVYMISGGGRITLTELTEDVTGIKPGGTSKVIIENGNAVFGPDQQGGLGAEGSHMYKVNGKYYLFLIASPRQWFRTVLLYRADNIEGPYEGKVAFKDQGVAQGGLVTAPNGEWFAYLFGDRGAVGRIPYLVPVKWEDGWPVIGVDGKVPETLDLPDNSKGIYGIVASDEFERKEGDPKLPLEWQWNHNPDNKNWEILGNPGRFRITTGRVDKDVVSAKNMLTQRTFGPVSSASTCVDVSNMKDGDVAGFIALQSKYGYVAVKMADGKKSIVMVSAQGRDPEEVEAVPFDGKNAYFKIDCDFRNQTDRANFYYSLDGKEWKKIGSTLRMSYELTHFMGYRFGLFNYATQTVGGYVDFDYYRIAEEITPVN